MSTDLVHNPLTTIPYTDNETVYNPIAVDNKEGRLAIRNKLDGYEDALKELFGSDRGEMDDINDNGLTEFLMGSAYVRCLFIPKENTIVSKLWNRDRVWIISEGEVTFVTEMGLRRVKAPYTQFVPQGSKVALYAHEDTVWYAVAQVKTKNIEEAELEVTATDYSKCTYPWDKIEDKTGEVK